MTKITKRVSTGSSVLFGRRARAELLAVTLLLICVVCEGQSKCIENQQSKREKKVQQTECQEGAEMKKDLRQQIFDANTIEEFIEAEKIWIADLKRRHGGTIDASLSGPDSRAHRVRFSKLMREWNPIHCAADDLKSIAGKPTTETTVDEARHKYVIEYRFNDGSAAVTWIFTTSVGTIVGVEYQGPHPTTKEKERQPPIDEKRTEVVDDPRQRYINADTDAELAEAKKAWIADLQLRYGSTIDASVFGKDSAPHSLQFWKLMREWSPLHFSPDDLKSIAGKPTSERKMVNETSKEDTIIEYVFDNGWNSKVLTFTASDGAIYKVEYQGH